MISEDCSSSFLAFSCDMKNAKLFCMSPVRKETSSGPGIAFADLQSDGERQLRQIGSVGLEEIERHIFHAPFERLAVFAGAKRLHRVAHDGVEALFLLQRIQHRAGWSALLASCGRIACTQSSVRIQ